VQQQIAAMKNAAGVGRHDKSEKDSKKAAADAAINSVLFQEAKSKKDLAREALAKAAAKAEKAKAKEPEKKDIYVDMRDVKKEKEKEGMEDWDDAKLAEVVNQKKKGQGERCQTDIICKHFLDAVEKRQYGWFWECPNGGDKCQYRHALPEGYVLKRDRDPNAAVVDEGPSLEDEIEEQRKAITSRTPVTFERLQEWLEKKVAAQREAEEAEMASLRTRYQKTGKSSGITGRQLFSIDASLFVDDSNSHDIKYERAESDDEEEGAPAAAKPAGAGAAAMPTPPPPQPSAAATSAAEPSYSSNYAADGTVSGEAAGGGAAVPDLEGVDESLFLDDDLPDDDD
jgi:uncharacterized protein (UPF0335 family)